MPQSTEEPTTTELPEEPETTEIPKDALTTAIPEKTTERTQTPMPQE